MKNINHVLDDNDTQPWYKQFWLWVLILLPTVAVIASLSLVYIAYVHQDTIDAEYHADE